jgi:Tubulin binding cofactor A
MASTATDDVGRSLKIKASTVRRIHKEYSYYQSELKKESDRVEGLKAAAADPHDLRQAVRARCAAV